MEYNHFKSKLFLQDYHPEINLRDNVQIIKEDNEKTQNYRSAEL
jgi:hypothetical protein